MTELLTSIGIWAVVLTLGLYQLGLWVQKKTGLALCNPILIAAAAVILLLLALAYEYSGHKNFPKMGYDKAVMDYQLTPGGYTLTVGEKSATIKWDGAWIVETKHDLLLYSDKNNCSVLPKRFLQDGEKEKILSWASKK